MDMRKMIGGLVTAALVLGPIPARAAVVTDNNLVSVALPDLQSSKNLVSQPFSVVGGTHYVLRSDLESTETGYDIANYNIQAMSTLATPTSTTDLLARTTIRTLGNPYPKATITYSFTAPVTADTLHLALGMGRFDSHGAANYSWLASDIRLFSAGSSADAGLVPNAKGNLVPNASFEEPTVNYWSGGIIVEAAGKHGTQVLEIRNALDRHIGIPVVPGQPYYFSFWSASPDIGNGHQIEHGFSMPLDGWTLGSGNTGINLFIGGGARDWTEYSGYFTPAVGQTMWYVGGMANGGAIQFDSIYVTQLPEPSAALLLGLGLLGVWRRRRLAARR